MTSAIILSFACGAAFSFGVITVAGSVTLIIHLVGKDNVKAIRTSERRYQ